MPLTLQQLLSATRGNCPSLPNEAVEFRRIELDSRKVQPGDLFWAVQGERCDGHTFVAEALRNGAAGCVVRTGWCLDSSVADSDVGNRSSLTPPPLPPLVKGGSQTARFARPVVEVKDTLVALQSLARSHRLRMPAAVVGVTGSVGKTSTRNMIHSVLSARFDGVQSPKNFNNHIGVPLSLLEIAARHAFAVLEMGASHVGEIRELAQIAKPDIGVITAVAPAHVEGFASLENIESAKGELVESLPPHGLALLNGDDPRVRRMAKRARCRVLLIGESSRNHIAATDVRSDIESLTFRVGHDEYMVPLTGRHFLISALAAVALGREFGMSHSEIQDGLGSVEPVEGRCVIRQFGGITAIDDTYNANPASVEAAIRMLAEWPAQGRRIAVLGDMKELGAEAAAHHRKIGQLTAELGLNALVTFGEHAADTTTGARFAGMKGSQFTACFEFDTVLRKLDQMLRPGDVVLVKGSRSTQMERVITWLGERHGSHETRTTPEAASRDKALQNGQRKMAIAN